MTLLWFILWYLSTETWDEMILDCAAMFIVLFIVVPVMASLVTRNFDEGHNRDVYKKFSINGSYCVSGCRILCSFSDIRFHLKIQL